MSRLRRARCLRRGRRTQRSRVPPFSRASVYNAWTNETSVASWFNRRTATFGLVKLSLQVGGGFMFDYQKESGDVIRIHGRYLEITPLEKLAFTWLEDNHSGPSTVHRQHPTRVTVRFKDLAGGTEVTVVHDQLSSEAVRNDFAEGWDDCLRSIEDRLGR